MNLKIDLHYLFNIPASFLPFQPLKDIAALMGQTARFECIIEAEPQPEVVWSKNGEIIKNSCHYEVNYRNGVCRLVIPIAYPGKN